MPARGGVAPRPPLDQGVPRDAAVRHGAGWNIVSVPPLTDVHMDDRKNYNTHMFAQGNEGHEFNAVLTDDERHAIIEYLKTL